ncbi:MAG: glycoside hydrolase family 5 protein, partial [Actinomycetota bacterium]|nr:glycoside hydrolase family 5 protein [Actinomycetota bacterium]
TEAPTTTTTAAPTTTTTTAPTPVTDGLAVSGNTLVAGGEPVRLLGVNRSGSEYACIQGFGIFDGPVDDAAIDAIASWNVNTVRIPMNEDCWLGQNAPAQYSGENYRSAIEDFVNRLNAAGMYAVLDLHWSGPNSDPATGQTHLADAQDAPDFWASVAERFEDNPNVAFDLYNEPHNVSWDCWLNGCETQGFQAAGMQELVDAVRSTGATQPIILTGLRWGNDLTGWLSHMPDDPQDALVAGFHLYNFNACIDSGCWGSEVGSVAAQVPVVTGELGENDCSASFINGFMDWADANGVSYLGWAWNTYSCGGFPALITDYDGTPTAFGAGLKARLAEVNG